MQEFTRTERLRLERVVAAYADSSNDNDENYDEIQVRLQVATTATDRHPLRHSNAVELLQSHRVRHWHASSGSRPSNTFPAVVPTGSAGIHVKAEFFMDDAEGDFGAAPSESTLSAEDVSLLHYKKRFLALLRDMVGTRRVLTAPLGYSMEDNQRRLHRHIHIEKSCHGDAAAAAATGGNDSCSMTVSTTLTLDNSMFSTESLHAFLSQSSQSPETAKNIMTAVGTAAVWSNWFLGSGPQSLDEARLFDREGNPIDDLGPHPQRRNSLWMDWIASDDACCFGQGPHSTNSSCCVIQTQQGIQYSILRPKANNNWALASILPTHGESSQRLLIQPDPFADETVLELVGLTWTCDDDSAVVTTVTTPGALIDDDDRTVTIVRLLQPLDATQACLAPTISSSRTASAAAAADDSSTSSRSNSGWWWSVESHLWRSAGQASRGAWSVVLRNEHPECAAQVSVQQHILGVLEPVWQSLQIIVADNSNNNNGTEQVMSWWEDRRLRMERNVQFLNDGSAQLQFQYTLPQQSALEVWFEYEPKFMNIDQFPGDANRGFELPPVRAQFRLDLDGQTNPICEQLLLDAILPHSDIYGKGDASVTLFSNSLLLLAPLPDMSMPFNVISLTCTLYAFVAGSLINLLVKKANRQIKQALQEEATPRGVRALLGRIRLRLRQRFLAVAHHVPDETEREEE